jgi:hypothetical protein
MGFVVFVFIVSEQVFLGIVSIKKKSLFLGLFNGAKLRNQSPFYRAFP